jgi:hypothetical protein
MSVQISLLLAVAAAAAISQLPATAAASSNKWKLSFLTSASEHSDKILYWCCTLFGSWLATLNFQMQRGCSFQISGLVLVLLSAVLICALYYIISLLEYAGCFINQ